MFCFCIQRRSLFLQGWSAPAGCFPLGTIILCGIDLPRAKTFSLCVHHVPGDFVSAGHGDELLSQQDPVPRLRRVVAPHGDGPFARLDLRPQVPAVFPHYVLAAVHWAKQTQEWQELSGFGKDLRGCVDAIACIYRTTLEGALNWMQN